MDESTDVDRMLARLGDTYIRYREFADPVVRTGRAWPIAPDAVVEQPTVGAWNTGTPVAPRPVIATPATPVLATETLVADPEAPGGRLAAVHLAEQRGEPIPDLEAEGRTPPVALATAPVATTPAPPPSAVVAAVPVPAPPPVTVSAPVYAPPPSPKPTGNLDTLFRRVSGTPDAPAKAGAAPLSSVFKRLS